MKAQVIYGDILEIETDFLVIPTNPNPYISNGFSRKVYTAAGAEELLKERHQIGKIKVGDAKSTPGFNLKAKHIIHTPPPSWYGGYNNECKKLTNCYLNSLRIASKANAQTIAFPLLGAGLNRIPASIAKSIALDAINRWLNSHQTSMKVYLVIHPDNLSSLDKAGDIIALETSPTDSLTSKIIQEMELEYKKCNKETGKSRDDYFLEIFHNFLITRISNNSTFAKKVFYDASSIGRLKNNPTQVPQSKNKALSLAIGMNLTLEERIRFMYSLGYHYPEDDRDTEIEKLLTNNIIDFCKINDILFSINQDWDLTKQKRHHASTKTKH